MITAITTPSVIARASNTPAPPSPTLTPTLDVEKTKPNELGRIPILEYHVIGEEEGRWSRRYDNFRRDLERLYALGYRAISLRDLIDNRITIPAGYSPVVITFDDSSPGQFRYLEEDGKLVVDPKSAVGILEAFAAEHPDFGLEATFFVLPAADPPHDLFGQKEYQKQKLQHLVAVGIDIGNHTYWHQPLAGIGADEVRQQLGLAVKVITEAVPGYEVVALALPQGVWPDDPDLAKEGEYDGVKYHHRAVLLVGAEPAPAPDRKGYDPYALPRIQAIQEQLDYWLSYLEENPDEKYVSDGDPDRITFPLPVADKYQPAPQHRELPSASTNYRTIAIRQ